MLKIPYMVLIHRFVALFVDQVRRYLVKPCSTLIPYLFPALPFWKRQLPVWRGGVSYHLAVRWVMLGCALHFALHSNPAFANPMGAQVVAGGAQIENAGSVVNITQTTDRAVINWQGFSIAGHEVTNFIQPNASSAVLNRVTSGEASQIMGALNANGQVYLINPAGVMIGNGAVVNVGSFVATTANVGDESFMQGGAMNFVGATDAAIRNEGTIITDCP